MRLKNRTPFAVNAKEKRKERAICKELARMRGTPVGAFFTTSGALYEDTYNPAAQHGWLWAFQPSGKEIKTHEQRLSSL